MTSVTADTAFGYPHWVNQLPADFYRQTPKVRRGFNPAMAFTVGVDLVVRTGLSVAMAGFSIPSDFSGAKLASVLRQGSEMNGRSDAELFHQPRTLPELEVREARRPKGVDGGIFEQLQWRSLYQPDVATEPTNNAASNNATSNNATSNNATSNNALTNNDSVVAWYWRHGDKPRPTIVLVHGFLAPWWEINEFYLGLRFLYDLGCDVVLKTLPHHGPRARSANRVSGMGYFSRGVDSLNHAVVQSTYDIRTLVDVLQQRGVDKIGLSGVSLGGYTTALMAGLDDRFDFVMPLVPLISIPDAIMEWKPLDRIAKNFMRRYDVDMRDLRNTMAFHSPLSRPALLPPDRLLIIAGMGDCLASPRHSEALQQHWGNCDLHWYAGAHALPRQQYQTNLVKQAFLTRIGFI